VNCGFRLEEYSIEQHQYPINASGAEEQRRQMTQGQEASLAPPCSNLRFFGSKCTLLKTVDKLVLTIAKILMKQTLSIIYAVTLITIY